MKKPDAQKQSHPYALLIIDMINNFDFIGGNTLLNHTEQIINPLLTLKKKAKKNDVPIIYINDHFYLWQANYHKIIEHCTCENNKELLSKITPEQDDYFLIKPKHSAFYGTALHTLLNQLNAKNLIITGVAGNICVLFSANDAYMREFNIWVPSDCIASNTIEENEYALNMMENVLGANIEESSKIAF
jgi:nicotinamidase-related amidase